MVCKREFLAFKLQATIEWRNKTCRDLWSVIRWNRSLQNQCPNLFVVIDLARIQCVSTFTCKRVFNVQKLIKIWVRNGLRSKNLKTILRIALERLDENFDNIIEEAIFLWKNGTKYQFLYVNSPQYVSSASDASCSVSLTMFYNFEDTDV